MKRSALNDSWRPVNSADRTNLVSGRDQSHIRQIHTHTQLKFEMEFEIELEVDRLGYRRAAVFANHFFESNIIKHNRRELERIGERDQLVRSGNLLPNHFPKTKLRFQCLDKMIAIVLPFGFHTQKSGTRSAS